MTYETRGLSPAELDDLHGLTTPATPAARQCCRKCLRSCVPAVTLTFDGGTRRLHWCAEHAHDAERYGEGGVMKRAAEVGLSDTDITNLARWLGRTEDEILAAPIGELIDQLGERINQNIVAMARMSGRPESDMRQIVLGGLVP